MIFKYICRNLWSTYFNVTLYIFLIAIANVFQMSFKNTINIRIKKYLFLESMFKIHNNYFEAIFVRFFFITGKTCNTFPIFCKLQNISKIFTLVNTTTLLFDDQQLHLLNIYGILCRNNISFNN
jgi:uncharacterized membrane protein